MKNLKPLIQKLFDSADGISRVDLDVFGHTLPVKFKHSQHSKQLLVIFHGAIDRTTRDVPFFPPFFPELGDGIAQISISDPTIMQYGTHGIGWYAGSAEFPLQKVLIEILGEVFICGNYQRVVFVGSSSGGFASLFYSSFFSGSIAIAGCPQTNLYRYYSGHLKR